MNPDQTALPGLSIPEPEKTAMEKAAQTYIDSLRESQLLQPHHVLTEQLILELARAIGLSAVKGRAAGMALASKQLMEAMESLPQPVGNDDFALFLEELKSGSTQ